jgi:ABC-2 type transport system ATP-binding protein
MALIELTEVEKIFTVRKGPLFRRSRTTVHAVRNLTLNVAAGEMVGYIGQNGAGKSTTIKILTGVLAPHAGRVRVDGLDPSRDRTTLAKRIGVVFGQRTSLWWDLPLVDSFELLRHLYRIPKDRYRVNLDRYVGLLDLSPFLHTPVRQLSLGQRMRGDITAALLHEPAILFLDEPTIGLDVISKSAVRAFLSQLNADSGTTVLLTTHDLDDIERLCRRVVVIDDGSISFDGTIEQLRGRVTTERMLVVDLPQPAPALDVRGARVVKVDGPRQWLSFPAKANAAAVINEVAARTEIVDLSLREPDIADVVKELYLTNSARVDRVQPATGLTP